MNYLSVILNACGSTCRVGDLLMNDIMYTDDLVILTHIVLAYNSFWE